MDQHGPTHPALGPSHHHAVLGGCSPRAVWPSRMQGSKNISGPSRTSGSSFRSSQGHQTNPLLSSLSLSTWQTGRIEPNYPKVCGHQGNVLDIKWNPFIDNIIASCSEDTSVSRRGAPWGGWARGDSSCFLLEAFLPQFPPSPFFAPLLSSWSSLQLAPGQEVRKGTGSESMNCKAGLVPLL